MSDVKVSDLDTQLTPQAIREKFRQGLKVPTAGYAPGYAQANLIAIPKEWAYDFLLYAQRNPKSCPLLDVTEVGKFSTCLAEGADLRTDFPAYRIWRDGKFVEEVTDARKAWSEYGDMVGFLIGCSFTFEVGLVEKGIDVRHISSGCNVPMYLTNIPCRSAGRVKGNLVVSMRPMASKDIADAVSITSRYPSVHGAPVHIGHPEDIGIQDLSTPDFGDSVTTHDDEIPVFWACGVTPQAAIMASNIPFAITHAPGHMFITDIPNSHYHI